MTGCLSFFIQSVQLEQNQLRSQATFRLGQMEAAACNEMLLVPNNAIFVPDFMQRDVTVRGDYQGHTFSTWIIKLNKQDTVYFPLFLDEFILFIYSLPPYSAFQHP